ncbi:vacuolar protein sorting-associated protein 54, chloroplastic [Triangularia verruculosa]|uniref:Vacuolar protein sorting-associated protein 54, chloroplastic n=1 Tax=Triangularia verruculosa TaxID=2587418 RepID=A0AAN6XJ27_9PEZI|nr:vacuolar protein sorting-associated protein 54, chloroplastic [Triangularia verruculosa]
MHAAQRSRRGSTISLMHPVGGHLDASTSSWSSTVFEPGPNAISTLLQPPIVRTGLQPHTSAPALGSHQTPTAKDIPPVALTNIRCVKAAEFEPYISQVGALYKQLQRLKESEEESRARGSRPKDSFGGNELLEAGGQSHAARKSSLFSTTSVTTTVAGPPYRGGSPNLGRKRFHDPPPLSAIPDVYFDQDFRLENPRTFDVVSERSDIGPQTSTTTEASSGNAPAPRKALATNAILQEKLSWYMDTVEVHLINSISVASTPFFSALGSLKELHREAVESVEQIRALRGDITSLETDVVTRGLELLQQHQIRYNLERLSDTVLQLKEIVDRVAYSESLVDEGEVERALVEIDAIELLMAGERDETFSGEQPPTYGQLRDMRATAALQGVVSDMTTLRSRIGKVFESKVHCLLLEDLRRHVQSVSTEQVLLRWEAASLRAKGGQPRELSASPAYMSMTDELRTALFPNVAGLYRSRSISTAIQAYRELVLREIRNVVRGPLPSSNDDTESITSTSTLSGGRNRTNQEKSSVFARNIRALDAEDAEGLFSTMFIGVAETLRRLKTQSSLLLDIACAIGNPGTEGQFRSPLFRLRTGGRDPPIHASRFEIQEEMHVALDLPKFLGQAVDVSYEKINKILRVRFEQTTSLPLARFLRYFTLNLLFTNECEAISGRAGASLKTIVNGHVQSFIQAHGDREKQVLAQGMDADNWQVKAFADRDDQILKQILECSTSGPPAWTEMSKIWEPLSEEEAGETESMEDSTAEEKVGAAVIDGEAFLLPYSAILCLRGVSRFLRLIGGIPSMTVEIAMSLVSYLQIFDSRCRQLILGAGAVRSAGLKNITTVHLALTLQALSFIATIIPHVREFVRRHVPAGRPIANATRDFDRVRHALQEQQDAIYQKSVQIMASRASILCKKARETAWSQESAEDVRKYARDLAKDTGKLYRALNKHLPEQAVRLVMVPVFASYKDLLGGVFKEVDPETEAGRDCMLRDVEHLVDKLGKVEGFGDLGTYLTKIIEDREIQVT